jgi:transcriptional regulator with XRE-family HTH domain
MNHDALASELIRALRGARSQGAVNRKLGRSSNVAHAWERGSRTPRASDFFKLARVAGIDVARVLSEFTDGPLSPVRAGFDARSTAAWLQTLSRARSHAELARGVKRDRNTVARWLSGDTEPRLPDLLRFVDATTQRMLDFVAAFVDPSSLASLRAIWADLERQRRLAYDLPWAHAVLRVLELDDYVKLPEHVRGFIAQRIGISSELEDECVHALAHAGQIRRRRGKWTLTRVMAVDTRDDPEGNLRLKRHWARVGAERLERATLPPGSQYSYNLFAISDEGLEQIRQAHLQYYERLRAIVAECKHPTQLALVNVQLLPLDA